MKKLSILFGIALLLATTFATGISGASAAAQKAGRQATPANTMEGKLRLKAIDTTSSAPRPVAGAAVWIFSSDGQVPTGSDVTDANGLFTTMLAPGQYSVRIMAKGYDVFGDSVKIVADESTELIASLIPSAPLPSPVPPGPAPSPCLSCDAGF